MCERAGGRGEWHVQREVRQRFGVRAPVLIGGALAVPLVGVAPYIIRSLAPQLHPANSATEQLLCAAAFVAVVQTATWGVRSRVGRPVHMASSRAWMRGAARFVLAGVPLVVLLSARTSSAAPVFDGARAQWLALTALLPALTEELAFRGLLMETVNAAVAELVGSVRVRAGVTLVVVSLTFALAHGGITRPALGWSLIAARSAAGLVFGSLALGDRSLLAPMLAHAMYDAAVAHCW